MSKRIFIPTTLACALALMATAFYAPQPASAEDASARTLCFLYRAETETKESPSMHGLSIEVHCAHADRAVLGAEPSKSHLEWKAGDTDMLAAGKQWLADYKKANPNGYFGSSSDKNSIEIPENSSKRQLVIKAESMALPKTGHWTLTGQVTLRLAGKNTVMVTTTAKALRAFQTIPMPDGGKAKPIEAGQSGYGDVTVPMIAIAGDGALIDVKNPPKDVELKMFFGEPRITIMPDVADSAKIELELAPSETVTVPVKIEM